MTLCIIPTFVRKPEEADVTIETLQTLRKFEPEAPVLVVDDCSPDEESLQRVLRACVELEIDSVVKPENEGFSKTVNHGLRRALSSGQDAVLVNADIEFVMPFLSLMEETVDSTEAPAAVVGALLFYPTGMIQHGGIFFSFLTRAFDHRFRFGPGGLPEAHVRTVCPVTGALQFIRHSTLETVGLYDEDFRMGYEDVDYCLRVFDADLECVYNPDVRAIHHESLFRGSASEKLNEWQMHSLQMLHEKHSQTPLGRWVPSIA